MSTTLPSVGVTALFDKSFEITDRGGIGLGVYVQDQTTPILTVPFLLERAEITLDSDTTINTRVINLTAGHSAIVGEIIELADTASSQFMQSKIISIDVNAITLDQPTNRIYTVAGSNIFRSTDNLLVDGSSTPQVFSILPLPTQAGDMVRIIINIQGTADMDHNTFGSDDALTNGCVLRYKLADGTFRNLFNFKSNGEFIKQGLDHDFLLPKQGGSTRGFASRVTWGGQSKHGAVIRLDGSLGEELQIIIQDDLVTASANTLFTLQAEGSELQGE